jgi:TRAP-type mannitol/chloroaromatic compound transport system permease large subunit
MFSNIKAFGLIHVHRKFNCGYATHFFIILFFSILYKGIKTRYWTTEQLINLTKTPINYIISKAHVHHLRVNQMYQLNFMEILIVKLHWSTN